MKYHTNTTGPDEQAFKTGFGKVLALASSCNPASMLLLTHTLGNLDGLFHDVLGEGFVKELKEKKVVGFNGVKIFLETERINSQFTQGPIFAPYVSPKFLGRALNDARGLDLIYLPWTKEELDSYIAQCPNSRLL